MTRAPQGVASLLPACLALYQQAASIVIMSGPAQCDSLLLPGQAVQQHTLADLGPHGAIVPDRQLTAAEVLHQANLVEVVQDPGDHPGCGRNRAKQRQAQSVPGVQRRHLSFHSSWDNKGAKAARAIIE